MKTRKLLLIYTIFFVIYGFGFSFVINYPDLYSLHYMWFAVVTTIILLISIRLFKLIDDRITCLEEKIKINKNTQN